MGRVSHQDFFSFDNHGCMCDELMGDEDECCNDEIAIVTIEEDQQVASQLISIIPKLAILFSFDQPVFAVDLENSQRVDLRCLEDPPPKNHPIYQLNCTYTFYG